MEVLKCKFTQGLAGLTYIYTLACELRLQSQHARMPEQGCPQRLTRTIFKAHAHFRSQHLLIKLSRSQHPIIKPSVPHEYGMS